MQRKLAELIDIPKLQQLLDSLYQVSGVASAILDVDGTVLTASGWQAICVHFHRCNPQTLTACRQSEAYIAEHLESGERFVCYQCANGLIDASTPIIVEGKHLGTAFMGQLFLQEPDVRFFQQQAETFGFDREGYLAALKRVPIVSQERLERNLDFLAHFAEFLADTGVRHLHELEAQEALKKSEDNYRSILNNVHDAIFIHDFETFELIGVNQRASEMYGYPKAEMHSILVDKLSAGYPPYTPEDSRKWLQRAVTAGPQLFEWLAKDRDGKLFWVEITLKMAEHDGKKRILAIIRDITERKEAEEERLRFQQEQEKLKLLQQAEQLKDQFLSILSHELRTPLSIITGFASILDDEVVGRLSMEQHQLLAKILRASENLMGLVNDLLDMSRIQAGKFSINLQPLQFSEIARQVVEDILPLATPKKLQLINEVPSTLPPLVGDEQRIRQVLVNLLGNATKFTKPGGKIWLSARVEAACLRCEVHDTGIGIASEHQDKLFLPFSQLDMSYTRKVGGTGLGLSISKAIVEAHGGNIGVESEWERGSTFWFTLPLD